MWTFSREHTHMKILHFTKNLAQRDFTMNGRKKKNFCYRSASKACVKHNALWNDMSLSTADAAKIKHFSSCSKRVDKLCYFLSACATDCVICFVRTREEEMFCHHYFVRVFVSSYRTTALYFTFSKILFSFSFTALSFCCMSLAAWLCRPLFFSTYRTSSLSVSLAGIRSNRRPCQEDDTVFTVSLFVRERVCISVCLFAQCAHPCVCASICGVVLPFPVLGMFKASSCAVRMCLSLFSKNTCSAFYQRAELGRHGAVQGWAWIIKHQQVLIHPDWIWLWLFAVLVWLGLVGHGGLTVLGCGGLVLLWDWMLFVVRWNWS